eukprot:3916494-Prymnesium_polylepis.1
MARPSHTTKRVPHQRHVATLCRVSLVVSVGDGSEGTSARTELLAARMSELSTPIRSSISSSPSTAASISAAVFLWCETEARAPGLAGTPCARSVSSSTSQPGVATSSDEQQAAPWAGGVPPAQAAGP